MKTPPITPQTIDDYIAGFPADVQARLRALREVVRRAAPEATERIAYRMPTYWQGGNLVHFAAFDRHIGFYPTPSGIATFQRRLARYKSARGSVQFPHDEPLPLDLVEEIVRHRVAEQAAPKAVAPKAARPTRRRS